MESNADTCYLLAHKSSNTTLCIYREKKGVGLQLGNYHCVCREGTSVAHVNSTDQVKSSIQMEEEYYQVWHPGLQNNTLWSEWKCMPCSADCDAGSCRGDASCTFLPDLHYRLPLVIINVISILAVLMLVCLTLRYRHEKVIRASSPSLLFVTLFGAILLYTEVIIVSFVATDITCMLQPWVRHLGFATAYAGLLFKTWRISVIMRVYKSRLFRTENSELFRKMSLYIFLWVLFLLIWTIADPSKAVVVGERGFLCQLKPWTFVATAGEFVFLCWGFSICYMARKAPDLYNETRSISYILWNEAIWEIFYITSRLLINAYPDNTFTIVIYFLRTQFSTTVLLVLLFTPKFLLLFGKIREVKGTLTDVCGPKRVHRLSLVVNKAGDIRTIYCVPCGPLVYNQVERSDGSETSSQQSSNEKTPKEDEYSKAEVDALIDMVSKLKSEQEMYRLQIRKLLQMLRSSRRPSNSISAFSPSSVMSDDSILSRNKLTLPVINEPLVGHFGSHFDGSATNFMGSLPGRASRASTCTTYVSTPDDASLTFSECRNSNCVTPCDDNEKFVWSPNNQTNNGISQYAWNVIRRQLAQNHVLCKESLNTSSPETEDFPRIVHPHEGFCNKQSAESCCSNLQFEVTRPSLSTVFGWDISENFVLCREMQDLSPVTPSTSTSPDSSSNVSNKTAETPVDKPNFIMYI